jgi:protein-S-isoprenylcysteine O-methyltransferase Ste14
MAIAALGKFWSLHVEIRENHEFIQTGPFRWVRHPTYLSMILELLALALICNAFFTLLLIPLFFLPVLIMRIRIEEVALVEKFGDAYRNFQRTKSAVIPGIW